MLRNDLVKRLMRESEGLRAGEVRYVVEVFFDHISASLVQGERLELRGFGTFAARNRAAREARDPRNGATVSVAARKHVQFKAAKLLSRRVNGA